VTRVPDTVHRSRPWRIHEVAREFELEDVWALPTPGGPDDFPRLVEMLTGFEPAESGSAVVRALFAIRFRLGELLGWDDEEGFTAIYELEDEWAAEIDNATVRGIIHLGWVAGADGTHHGEMAIYVRRKGLLGAAYMAAITPFRHLLVYPRLLAEIEREWRAAPAA
jgi:hypothetical protein